MISLVATVFVASLLGSLHCVGMCGPLLAFAVGQPGENQSHRRLQVAYHGGRLATYALLGTAGGSVGALVDMTSTLAGLQPIAMTIAGGMMIGLGVTELLRQYGHRIAHVHPPKILVTTVQRGQKLALAMRPTRRALAIGLLTTLLPCGWLYAFAITAAGTSSPLWGAVVMAVFWIGTLPVLVSLGAGVQALMGTLGVRLPTVCAVALITIGLTTLVERFGLEPPALAQAVEVQQQGEVADPQELPPCCRDTQEPPAFP